MQTLYKIGLYKFETLLKISTMHQQNELGLEMNKNFKNDKIVKKYIFSNNSHGSHIFRFKSILMLLL